MLLAPPDILFCIHQDIRFLLQNTLWVPLVLFQTGFDCFLGIDSMRSAFEFLYVSMRLSVCKSPPASNQLPGFVVLVYISCIPSKRLSTFQRQGCYTLLTLFEEAIPQLCS